MLSLLTLSFPFFAHASTFSLFTALFEDFFRPAPRVSTVNSQTIRLLEPSYSPVGAVRGGLGGADLVVTADSALVPQAGPLGTVRDIASVSPSGDRISLYEVREGDSLSDIAGLFDVSVNTIIWANDGAKRGIRPGDILAILPVSGVRHSVVKGDTLVSIAKKYRADVDDVRSFNGIVDDLPLVVGTEIIVPDGEVGASSASPSTRLSSAASGYYIRPVVRGVITQGIHGYNGIDFGAASGESIRASASGSVIISRSGGWNGGYGNYVVIAHDNGTQTLYAHNSENLVAVGDIVSQGDVIARVGNTGKSTGPHLHFEVRGARNPFTR